MIDHLICDCDGVLVDSEIIADRVMLETLSATFPGLDFEPVVKTAFGQQTRYLFDYRHGDTHRGEDAGVEGVAEHALGRLPAVGGTALRHNPGRASSSCLPVGWGA